MGFFVYMHVCAWLWRPEGLPGPLGLELQEVVRCYVTAENQTISSGRKASVWAIPHLSRSWEALKLFYILNQIELIEQKKLYSDSFVSVVLNL